MGAYLGKNSKVVLSRDVTKASSLIKHAFTAGLLSMGVDVFDMDIETVPINRYCTKFLNADMGIYIQVAYLTGLQNIQIQFFNRNGFQIQVCEEKRIENIFFRGDYPRKDVFEAGEVIHPSHHIGSYISNMINYVNRDTIKEGNWKVILDCLNGNASYIFPELLDSMHIRTTVLRGQMKETLNEYDIMTSTIKSIYNVVNMSRMNREIGVIIGPHGTNMTIIDEMGNVLTSDDVTAILSLYYLKYSYSKTISLPVNTSNVISRLIQENGGSVKWTTTRLRIPDDSIDIFFGGKSRHPFLEQKIDPMITFLRVLEYLTLEQKELYEVREILPRTNLLNTTIQCSIEEKASIMAMLSGESDKNDVELIDGIKIIKNNSWILLLPDSSLPLIHIYAEGDSTKERDKLINNYSEKIKLFRLGHI